MAAAVEDTSLLEEELTCPVCLDLYRDPRLLPCGHNFCLVCLRRLKGRSERGRLRCPECRQSHRCSAPWQKNFKLANIADGFRRRSRTEPQRAGRQSPTHRPEEVLCDYCSPEASGASKACTAVKTCLKCEVSMCPEHVQPHLELPAFREHPLVEPLRDLRTRKCAEHDEMFRYYCVDERVFLCNACTIEGAHSGHAIKTLKNTMRDMRASLDIQLQKTDRKIRRVERNMQDQNEVERQNKAFLDDAEQRVDALRASLRTQLESFLSSLSETVLIHETEHSQSVQQNISRISEDQSRLADIHTGIERLLQQHDPFQFITEYNACAKRYRRLLRRPLFVAHSLPVEMDFLGEIMVGKMDEFMTDVRQQINLLIDTLCAGGEGDEGVEDEDEDEASEENEVDSSEEDGEEEEEMRSEEEEEEELDHSESTDEDYSPEEEEEEENE